MSLTARLAQDSLPRGQVVAALKFWDDTKTDYTTGSSEVTAVELEGGQCRRWHNKLPEAPRSKSDGFVVVASVCLLFVSASV